MLSFVSTRSMDAEAGLVECWVVHERRLFAISEQGVHVDVFASGIAALLDGVSRVIGRMVTTQEPEWSGKESWRDWAS